MPGGREPGHIGAGLGHDDLRNRLPDPGNRLQQLDLMRPRPERLSKDRLQLGQGLLDQLEAVQDRLRELGMVGVEVAC